MAWYETPVLSFFSHIWATHSWNHSSSCFGPGWLTLRQTFRNILFIPCNICTVFPLLLLLFYQCYSMLFFFLFSISFSCATLLTPQRVNVAAGKLDADERYWRSFSRLYLVKAPVTGWSADSELLNVIRTSWRQKLSRQWRYENPLQCTYIL